MLSAIPTKTQGHKCLFSVRHPCQNRHMITREQLSELLRQVDAKALATEAGVNIKTIYRLRHGENSPRLELVERLVAACRKLKGRKA
jgi:hypothetical protein